MGSDNSVLAKIELTLERKIYRQSFYEFYKAAFCQLHPGTDYDENWHARYIADILQKEAERIIRKEKREKDIIINVPFRSSKSVLTTICFPVWCWTIDPSMKFITTSYSGDLALEHSRRSRDLIQTKWFQRLWGSRVVLRADAAAAGNYETTATGIRKAVGIGGQITGSGCDIIICLRGDQKILTKNGDICISDIVENKLDVEVATFNHQSNEIEYKPILRYDKNKGKRLLKIKAMNDREIVCTEDHEVWTENRGYVKAIDLTTNDILRNA